MKLNFGCSDRLLPGYTNVDSFPPPPSAMIPGALFEKVDLRFPFPWETSTVEEIIADDIIEHLPDKIQTMNEIHRVLVPEGKAIIFVPTTDGRGAWQDPTHVSYWNRNSFFYYTKGVAEYERFHVSYGITACFHVISEEYSVYPGEVSKLRITLVALK